MPPELPELSALRALIAGDPQGHGDMSSRTAVPDDEPDLALMAAAVRLASAATGATYPNPCVGALVVQAGRVVGAGHSAATGGPHAEVHALAVAGPAARGATVYITLEPCSHHGRTPPCTDALIAAGVAEVVFGVRDPARHAAGRARAVLTAAGIRVREGVGEAMCAGLHEHYLHHEQQRRPFVTLKAATSLDGRIAARGGDSKWITGEPARRVGHWLRARHHAIAVGVDTLLRDDPRLDVRLVPGVDPWPVIVDSQLRSALAEPRPQRLRAGAIVLHTPHAPEDRRRSLGDAGLQLIEVPADEHGRVAIAPALEALGRLAIRSLLVEGGGRLIASFVAAAAWDRWYWFQAPCLLGEGTPVLPGLHWPSVAQSPRLRVELRVSVGLDDLRVLRPAL
ncbi:bifunctional diaminohydroxyphosphoribosylaminopyrimidine deaminase/5-amino-6-(5-phosphoribosylamino)uracil reductase RibD [Nannocystis sp.]|uniref:bifunctional diaminohydroxyphosphoribosylaminopyrimidine deaminase/5-amino-6-(5-phosphoribosylamino)uracil reductase RibD n=1 Tax=Nannocystis sp. TaxID=1962667 RepID=UPI00242505DC|nr:bifunctional diaminohydroxyphosphoribosylaminopyrimidine deaminase/5-amino-6-(5-phosphoribosylamino)uracil reductase RibD [Nannocystis sp.]MBK7823851.1 bifunctional diaminohydroxyphosphoribosylaminopyrimidine deaminase/5-amino-6-(5-phosphoribosylamino)uracil reductase RibD [Nannocystis sp.]MBK9754862.1 bifunctional diaminohydroxyphosphoribosylaminopyrimidine deaminase/5-amino-6-(5-phosphoribosylamino)uracil reductase RibD [Nannocystis sp.]